MRRKSSNNQYRYPRISCFRGFQSATSHLGEYIYLPYRLYVYSSGAYFAIFYRKFRVFPFFSFFSFFSFSVFFFRLFLFFFETVCFGCFAVIPKQRISMFRLNRNKQKTHPNSLKESTFGYFLENLGLFRFVSVSYETVLFDSVVSIQV